MLSGLLNFLGVLIGGIAVAYALVELIPAEALSPPDGGPAVGMLVAVFSAALFWNIGTWWLGLPNSSSHCLIGSLIGVAIGNVFARSRSLSDGVHWPQLWKVLEALAISPILGFVLAGLLYFVCRKTLHDEHLYRPAGDKPPVWWMRGILILTCSGVSFAHGTNDGQKSIGLIMLTIIGLFPATYALNPHATVRWGICRRSCIRREPLIDEVRRRRETERRSMRRIRRAAHGRAIGRSRSARRAPPVDPGMTPDGEQREIRGRFAMKCTRVISQLKQSPS